MMPRNVLKCHMPLSYRLTPPAISPPSSEHPTVATMTRHAPRATDCLRAVVVVVVMHRCRRMPGCCLVKWTRGELSSARSKRARAKCDLLRSNGPGAKTCRPVRMPAKQRSGLMLITLDIGHGVRLQRSLEHIACRRCCSRRARRAILTFHNERRRLLSMHVSKHLSASVFVFPTSWYVCLIVACRPMSCFQPQSNTKPGTTGRVALNARPCLF